MQHSIIFQEEELEKDCLEMLRFEIENEFIH